MTSADVAIEVNDRVRVAVGPHPKQESLGWVAKVTPAGYWVHLDSGHTWLVVEGELSRVPAGPGELEKFLGLCRRVEQDCPEISRYWTKATPSRPAPMVNPRNHVGCCLEAEAVETPDTDRVAEHIDTKGHR